MSTWKKWLQGGYPVVSLAPITVPAVVRHSPYTMTTYTGTFVNATGRTYLGFLCACFGAFLITLTSISTAFGQLGSVSRYTLSSETGTWVDATASGTRLGAADDNEWPFTLPFDVIYDSATVPAGTRVAMTDDGDFSFKDFSGGYSYCTVELGSSQFPGAIAAFNIDWIFNGGSPRGDWWTVTGSAPNRILTMEWYENTIYAGSTTTSFELQIHETSGVIEILYADHSLSTGTSDCGHGAYVGLNGLTNPTTDYIGAESATTSLPPTDFKFSPPLNRAPQLSLQPKALNFGTLPLGDTVTYCVTATSAGNQTLIIDNYYIQGDTNFSIVSGLPIGDSILSPAQFCIRFIARPSTHTANFVLVTNGRDSGTQIVALSGGGQTPLISFGATSLFRRVRVMLRDTSPPEYIPVTSTGQAPVTFNSIYIIGLNPDNYFVSYRPQNPLPPDATDSIGITFAPTLEGHPDAEVVISTNAFNTPWDTVSLFGIGTLPHIVDSVPPPGSGNTVMFDSVALGDSACQTIMITNPGTDTLDILKQIVTYGDYDFTFSPLTGTDTIIPPEDSQFVNICFKPLKVGTRVATVRFYTNIPLTFEKPPRDTSQLVLNISGIGVPYGQLAVAGGLADTAIVGKTQCLTDTLVNRGQTDLTVTGATITPATTNFMLSGVTLPLRLAAGQSQVVSICFTPSKRGIEFDTLLLTGTTSEKSITQPVFLQGVGVITCVTVDTLVTFGTAGMTLVGTTDTSCITVSNCGDLAAAYTVGTLAGSGFTLLPPLTSIPITPGDSTQFCVAFTPAALGSVGGTVQITGGPTPHRVVLNGMGAGVIASATGVPSAPVTIGMCDTFSVQIRNNGNVPWTPGTGHISGMDSADFTIQSGPTPSVIPPNGTATVVINFCPKLNGPEPMTLAFPNASPQPIAAFSYMVTAMGTSAGVTTLAEEDGFALGQSYPNPTNGSAEITVTMPYDAPVRIDIVDPTGSIIRNAFSGRLAQGKQIITLDAKGLPSGTYFYTLTSGADDRSSAVRLTRQLSLIK